MSNGTSKYGLSVKDWIIIAALLFEAGGAFFMLRNHDSRIEKIEGINPQLIEYRLGKIEESVKDQDKKLEEIKDLIIQLK